MIRYALACDQAHDFESWFPSSEAYDQQAARGLVTCPVCDSGKVTKRIMAPSVARSDKAAPPAVSAPAPAPQAMALLSEPEQKLRALVRAFREHVMANAENLGPRFADEARRIHYGEAEERSICGEASPAEAQALVEEGIGILPLPVLPDDRN